MVIAIGEADDQCGSRLGQTMGQSRILGDQHLGDTVNGRSGLTRGGGGGARAENGHIAQSFGGSYGLGGGIHRQFAIIDFGKQENSHYTTPFSLSLATSVSTSATISPA